MFANFFIGDSPRFIFWLVASMMADMTHPYPSNKAEKIVVRLPDGMRDALAAIAKANKRSVNAEVVARLEQTFANPMVGLEGILTNPELYERIFERALKQVREAFSIAVNNELTSPKFERAKRELEKERELSKKSKE